MPASTPYILVDIADDKPYRGDVRAVRGIAKAVARKQGWGVRTLDNRTPYPKPLGFSLLDMLPVETRMRMDLEGLKDGHFGELGNRYRDHIHRVRALITLHGPPQMVVSTPSARIFEGIRFASTDPEATFRSLYQCEVIARDWAENFSRNAGTGVRGDALVAHDLEPQDFAKAEADFRARHPELLDHGPLVTVFYADHCHLTRVERTLTRLMANEDRATLVLCGAPRTEGQEKVEAFFAVNLPDRVQLKSFRFDPGAAYNPYLGLVAASNHLVRRGISQSIDSEVFATGKPVHVLASKMWDNPLEARGYYRNLAGYAKGDRLNSPRQEPLNITDELADKLIAQYKAHQLVPTVAATNSMPEAAPRGPLYR